MDLFRGHPVSCELRLLLIQVHVGIPTPRQEGFASRCCDGLSVPLGSCELAHGNYITVSVVVCSIFHKHLLMGCWLKVAVDH